MNPIEEKRDFKFIYLFIFSVDKQKICELVKKVKN
jgi:hypothetical protein